MINIFDPVMVNYIMDGIIGGLLYILVAKLGYNEKWDIFRRIVIGAIAGIIMFYAGQNHLYTIGVGYIGIDAIEAILKKRTEHIRGVPIERS